MQCKNFSLSRRKKPHLPGLSGMRYLLLLGFGCALVLTAQGEPVVAPAPLIYPSAVVQPAQALRQYLNLTEAQANALQEVQKSRSEAERAIYEQIRQKQTALN